ncbi:MAG: DM13 domain-containing protein [Phormidesmis sp.]
MRPSFFESKRSTTQSFLSVFQQWSKHMGRAIASVAWATLPLTMPLFEQEAIAQLPVLAPANIFQTSDVDNLDIAASEDLAAGTIIATGTFEGKSDHITTGSVDIVERGGKYYIELGDDFSLDNAPDPKVGLGKNGYDPITQSGELRSLTGASTYELPDGLDISSYNEVYIWCEKFSVPLGVAVLSVL